MVEHPLHGLFGAHVRRRANQCAGDGEVDLVEEARDSKVHQLEAAVSLQHDILKFQISMDDPSPCAYESAFASLIPTWAVTSDGNRARSFRRSCSVIPSTNSVTM